MIHLYIYEMMSSDAPRDERWFTYQKEFYKMFQTRMTFCFGIRLEQQVTDHVEPLFFPPSSSDDNQKPNIDTYLQRALLFHCLLTLTNGCFKFSVLSQPKTSTHWTKDSVSSTFSRRLSNSSWCTSCCLDSWTKETFPYRPMHRANTYLFRESFDLVIP